MRKTIRWELLGDDYAENGGEDEHGDDGDEEQHHSLPGESLGENHHQESSGIIRWEKHYDGDENGDDVDNPL